MGISPIHDSRQANGRFDSTVKALTDTKRRKEFKQAAKQEFHTAKRNCFETCASKGFVAKFIKLFLMIAFYFVSSIALTFYQKQLIVHIPLPISIVVFHLIVKFCMAAVCRTAYACKTGQDRVILTWKKYVSHVALAAAFSALDIGLSQWSFEYITISLYTMTKTTSIIFILIFAIFLKLEEKHWSQIVIVLFISVGLYLFTYRATSFDGLGFGLAFTASFLSGARWTFSQKVLQKSKLNLQNPIDFIYHIQPFMILTILPLAVYVEGSRLVASEYGFRFGGFESAIFNLAHIGVGGVMAFFMEVAEFLIITHASSLTLSVVGVVKEVIILVLSIMIKGNQVSLINVIGMLICLLGLLAHVVNKGIHECNQTKKSKSGNRNRTVNSNRLLNGDSDGNTYDFNLEEDSDSDDFQSAADFAAFQRSRGRSNFVQTSNKSTVDSIPLLNDDDDESTSDDDTMLRAVARGNVGISSTGMPAVASRIDGHRNSRNVDDSFYLSDQRRWTGVRDAHLEMRSFNES